MTENNIGEQIHLKPRQPKDGTAEVAAVPSSDLLCLRAAELRKAHVARVYRKEPLTPRKGWALRDKYMHRVAPHLAWCRGDGWWTKQQAMLYPTREMAKAVASEYRCRTEDQPDVFFVRHNAGDERRAGNKRRSEKQP